MKDLYCKMSTEKSLLSTALTSCHSYHTHTHTHTLIFSSSVKRQPALCLAWPAVLPAHPHSRYSFAEPRGAIYKLTEGKHIICSSWLRNQFPSGLWRMKRQKTSPWKRPLHSTNIWTVTTCKDCWKPLEIKNKAQVLPSGSFPAMAHGCLLPFANLPLIPFLPCPAPVDGLPWGLRWDHPTYSC